MQENEFEKQLKEMMDEFKLPPSASVWEKISRRLTEGRRKKRPFIFLLLFGLLISGYFMYEYAKRESQTSPITNNKTNNGINSNSFSSKDSVQLAKGKITEQNRSTAQVNKDDETTLKKVTPATNSLATFSHKQGLNKGLPISANTALPKYDNKTRPGELYAESAGNANNVPPLMDKQHQDIAPVGEQAVVNDSSNLTNTAANVSDKTLAEADTMQVKQDKKERTAQPVVKKPAGKNYTIPNWQWGVTAAYGRSNAIQDLVNSDKSMSNDLTSGPGAGFGRSDTPYTSKPYAPSNAYQFGFAVQKKIIKNGFIATGLNFIHLSTKADVNGKKDSAYTVQNGDIISNAFYVSSFYQPGSSTTYTNTYNFIELPVYFQQDILYRHKLSFSYNAGFSVRQLLSSDALIYNRAGNIYYSKDELLRKTQFQFFGGLNLKINTGKNTAIYVGPQFSYSLSNLLKDNNAGNFHLINYGLQAGLMFHKK